MDEVRGESEMENDFFKIVFWAIFVGGDSGFSDDVQASADLWRATESPLSMGKDDRH